VPARGAGAGRRHQGNDAENEGEGRHQDRTEPEPRRLHRGLDDAPSFLALVLGELDDEDGVFRRQPDQHHEADLRIDVNLHAPQP
jgi:hypothetical protein